MRDVTRRLLLGRMALASAGALLTPGAIAQAVPRRDIPSGTMRLTRILTRGLRDNATIIVNRSWDINFAHQSRGIAIEGAQVSAKVVAPAALQRLAKIEEARSTDAMFPILLSSSGVLMAAGQMIRREDLTSAVREAESIIAKRQISDPEKTNLRANLAQLQNSASKLLDTMPSDLFYPSTAPVNVTEPVDLPNGVAGEFELSYTSEASATGDWLSRAERRIVTRIGDSERQSSELWTMAAAQS